MSANQRNNKIPLGNKIDVVPFAKKEKISTGRQVQILQIS